MVHADVRNRSRALIAAIEEDLPRYVRHAGYDDARERLYTGKVLVIAGAAGVGKTTLAHLLVADALLTAGYNEPVPVLRNIEEGWRVFDPTRCQIILYDDFLGRTALNRLDKNEDRDLVALMRAVLRAPHTLLILTTREYILQHAAQLHSALHDGGIEERRYLLELGDYSLIDRAHIFINHANQANALTAGAREALLTNDAYREIIEHPRYNPRAIAYLTGATAQKLREDELENYVHFAKSVLDDPARIWREAFRSEIDDAQRALLLALATTPSEVEEQDLRVAFDGIAPELGIAGGEEAYVEALRALDDSMVRTRLDEGHIFVTLRDPSVQDYLTTHLKGTPAHVRACLRGGTAFEQVSWLVREIGAAQMADLVPDAAGALVRTFAAASISWHSFWWDDEPEPSIGRQYRDPAARLSAIHGFMQKWPALQQELQDWWNPALADWIRRDDRSLGDRGTVLTLTQAASSELQALPGGRERLASFFAHQLRYPMAWRELRRFRGIWPDVYTDEEWRSLVDRCLSWSSNELNDPSDLRDVEEVDDIESVASDFGISLPAELVDNARSAVEESKGSDYVDYEPPVSAEEAVDNLETQRTHTRELFVRWLDDGG
jgi:hypothetical protein